jgi:Outer membrane protein beta-barrel domain
MKTILLTLVPIFLIKPVGAQFQLGLQTDYHNSYLYNKSDAAADERLNYVNTYKPAFGVMIGYAFNEKVSVQISPQYYGAGQQFFSPSPALGFCKTITDNISLHYLQLPINFQYSIGNASNNLRQSVQLGLFMNSLISYSQNTIFDGFEITNVNKVTKQTVTYNGKSATATSTFKTSGNDSIVTTNFKLNHQLFNSLDIGITVGHGLSYAIAPNMALQLNAYAKYGFNNIDNLDSIYATNTANVNDIRKFNLKDVVYCRNNIANGGTGQPKRDPNSNNTFAGIQVSFIYTFNKKKSF